MSIDAAIDGIAEGAACFYQTLATYHNEDLKKSDLRRIVYNAKQVAFNVFATGAVLSVLFACATGSVALPIGLAIAFWAARTLVLMNITKDLERANITGIWGEYAKNADKKDPLNNVLYVEGHANVRLLNWTPGLTILGMTVYRNVIFRENLCGTAVPSHLLQKRFSNPPLPSDSFPQSLSTWISRLLI